MIELATVALGALIFVALAFAGAVSVGEGEPRAAGIAFFLSVVLPSPYLAVGLSSFEGQRTAAISLLSLTALAAFVLAVPFGKKKITEQDAPTGRIDERDIMFSRNLLERGSARFEEYYAAHPEKRGLDDAFRAEAGLLAKGSSMYDPYAYSAAGATESTVTHLRPLVDGAVSDERVISDPGEITGFMKGWVRKLGAVSVGVTELRDYHMYSTVGRGADFGQPVKLDHSHAIAFTVEMAKEMISGAPKASIVMESYEQYLACGTIAIQVAAFIRNLGYSARAHIDGNYRVVCPLVARDAGLGEIGRMGLLMTPELGPRVRLAVVTTDLPLVNDTRLYDHTTIDFCTHCRKCAEVCPSQAISFEARKDIDGVMRWRIDSEACFTLWCKMGTDCGRCVSVCPYSHPDNLLHNFVRLGVRNSSLFRRLAIWLDDFFYGKRPPPAELVEWMRLKPVAQEEEAS